MSTCVFVYVTLLPALLFIKVRWSTVLFSVSLSDVYYSLFHCYSVCLFIWCVWYRLLHIHGHVIIIEESTCDWRRFDGINLVNHLVDLSFVRGLWSNLITYASFPFSSGWLAVSSLDAKFDVVGVEGEVSVLGTTLVREGWVQQRELLYIQHYERGKRKGKGGG